VSPHSLLPLVAFVLNVSLAALALLRNPGSRLNRVFAYFASSMALWNFGSFVLRNSPDEWTAYFAEILIHAGIIAVPAFYYHFVLIFLDSTTRHRPSLVLAYLIAFVYELINLSGTPLFMTGVKTTYWGWAPATGPLYLPNFLALYGFMIYGVYQLVKDSRGIDSSFRRNRGTLIVLGTLVSLAGGFVDFARFLLARVIPAADYVYPLGIPANMVFALMLGTSIVRYRLFAVTVAVKKTAVYALVGTVITLALGVATKVIEDYFNLKEASALWLIVPMGAVITVLLSPLGQGLDDHIERAREEKHSVAGAFVLANPAHALGIDTPERHGVQGFAAEAFHDLRVEAFVLAVEASLELCARSALEIEPAGPLAQDVGDLHERRVPGGMALGVVVLLEVIGIRQQHRERSPQPA